MILCEAQEQTFNQRYENNFLARLRTLPEAVFRQCVYRLQDGETAIAVARWLLTLPNRGGMQSVNKLHTLRRYIEILARQVQRLKKHAPPAALTAKELQQVVEQERRRVDNEIAIAGSPLNSQFESIIESMINDHAKASNRRLWLQATAAMNLQRMRLAHCLEQRLKTPILEATKISQVIIQAAEADARAELADMKIRNAKEDESKAEQAAAVQKQYGEIDLDGLDMKEHPEPANSGAAPAKRSAVDERTYLVSREFIEAHINLSSAERSMVSAIINFALIIMYSADVLREMEEEAQSMRPTAGEKNLETGTMTESRGAAAQACATQTSPEEPHDADTLASSGEGPRPAEEELGKFMAVLMYTSAADRMAVSRALEATLMIIEQENVFCKQLQTPNGGEQSDAGSVRISAENFDLLQGAFTEAKSFSPEAKMMYTKVCEIAAKIINERLSREDGPVSDPPRKRRDQTSEPDGLLLRGP